MTVEGEHSCCDGEPDALRPDIDALLDKHAQRPDAEPDDTPPKGWEPGIRINEDGTGEATIAVPAGDEPAWDEHLREFGYGDVLDFVRVKEVRAWEVFSKHAHGKDQPGKVKLRYIKAAVVRRMSKEDKEDVDRLKEEILHLEPGPSLTLPTANDQWLFVSFADWQFGKREGGGSRATVDRIVACLHGVVEYAEQLRSIGLNLRGVIVAGLGDLVEACDGHYPMQAFQVDLHMRQQRAVVRRLLVLACKILRPAFDQIVFRAVPGNHGEVRKNGKAFTSFSDNNDVCIFDQLRDIVAEAPWNDGIDVWTTDMNKPELTMSFEVKDSRQNSVSIGLAHGHQSRGGPDKVKNWWKDCSASRHAIGYVDILNTGHYHHLRVEDRGERRTWIQSPTLDGGSFWWWSQGGNGSVPGMLTYVIDPSSERGWSWLKVINPRRSAA